MDLVHQVERGALQVMPEESSTAEVRGWIGDRTVRILEVADEWALVQPWDEPRTWELVRADLVVVERARRAVLAEPEVSP
jgi:hypothetical protein